MREDADPPRYELNISLRLRHGERRDLGGLLRQWNFSVDGEWQAGDPRRAPNGRPLDGVRRDSYAYARLLLPEVGSFSRALAAIVADLEPFQGQLQALADDGGHAELFAGWFFDANSGDRLDWTLMRDLAALRLALSLDVYPDEGGFEALDSSIVDEA